MDLLVPLVLPNNVNLLSSMIEVDLRLDGSRVSIGKCSALLREMKYMLYLLIRSEEMKDVENVEYPSDIPLIVTLSTCDVRGTSIE